MKKRKLKRDRGLEVRSIKRIYQISKRNAKSRDTFFDLSIDYLEGLWDAQEGTCVYSKVKLDPESDSNIFRPSLDRIDPYKGYIRGNVQFISITMNYMKHTMSHEEMLRALKILKE